MLNTIINSKVSSKVTAYFTATDVFCFLCFPVLKNMSIRRCSHFPDIRYTNNETLLIYFRSLAPLLYDRFQYSVAAQIKIK